MEESKKKNEKRVLKIYWSKKENNFMIEQPKLPTWADVHWINHRLNIPNLKDDLNKRGYDHTTFKIRVNKKVGE